MASPVRTFDVEGVTLSYEQFGPSASEKTLLLIHGLFGNTTTWRYILPQVSTCCCTIAVDLIGSGKSAKPADFQYTFRHQGQIIAKLIEALDLRKVVLVGHSAGAIVAAEAAASSARVCAAVFVGPGFFHPKPTVLEYMCAPLAQWLARRLIRNQRKILLGMHVRPDELPEDLIEAFEKPLRGEENVAAVGRMITDGEAPYQEVLHSVRVPMHFLWSSQDTVNPPAVQRIQAIADAGRMIAPARMEVIDACGHYIQHEAPDTLSKFVLDALA